MVAEFYLLYFTFIVSQTLSLTRLHIYHITYQVCESELNVVILIMLMYYPVCLETW